MSSYHTTNILNAINSSNKVINLAGGTPLFLVEEYLSEINCKKLFNHKNFEYPIHTQGLLELRVKVAQELTQEFNNEVNSDHVLITAGSTAGLYATLKTLLKKDDEIIVFSPHWSVYKRQIELMDAKMVEVLLNEGGDWDINFDRLNKAINKKTKCILLTNPTSPMSSVFPNNSIEKILCLAEKKQLYLIIDETYRHIIHQDFEFISPLKYQRHYSKIILLRSFSKDFSISGLRLGYVHNSSELINKIIPAHLAMNLSASVLSQSIVLELFRHKKQLREKIKKEYTKRYRLMTSFLNQWSSIFNYVQQSAGFFVFPKYNFNLSSVNLFEVLLNKYNVAIRPGSEFGKGGEGHVRISFSYPIKHIQQGLQRIDKFLRSCKK